MHRQVLVASPTDGQIRGCSFSPGCTGTRKQMDACSLWWSGCTGTSQELARLAHGKGCWSLLLSPTASSSGPACRIHPDPELPLLPGSSLGAGGGSCATGSKLGVVCAPWMSLQQENCCLSPLYPCHRAGTSHPVLSSVPVATQSLLVLQVPIQWHSPGRGCCPGCVSE